MKRVKMILLCEGILSFTAAAVLFYFAGMRNYLSILSAPLDLLGKALRWLSLSSGIGNILALIIYLLISILPILYLAIKYQSGKRTGTKLTASDILLPVISIFSFIILYEFINPGLMPGRLPKGFATEDFLPVLKQCYSITLYTLIIGYLILKMLGNINQDRSEDRISILCTRLRRLLTAMSVIYTFLIGYFLPFQMFTALEKNIKNSNTDMIQVSFAFSFQIQDNTWINAAFIILSYILKCLPSIFSIVTLVSGIGLIQAMLTDHMKENEIQAANRMGLIGKYAVTVTVISSIVLNLLQFLLLGRLYDTSFTLELSLFPLIIAVSAMILSGYFKETKELREDNEMII